MRPLWTLYREPKEGSKITFTAHRYFPLLTDCNLVPGHHLMTVIELTMTCASIPPFLGHSYQLIPFHVSY